MTSQTPEETHNTREIEEITSLKQEFIKNYCNHSGSRWLRGIFWDENEKLQTVLDYLAKADTLLAQHHHQLQKAREEERERAIEIIKEELRTASLEVQMTKGIVFANIIKRIHSELDQDKV